MAPSGVIAHWRGRRALELMGKSAYEAVAAASPFPGGPFVSG